MKIAFIATGAANMYCGSCMRDNTLAAAMRAQGVDVTLLPLYTPMRLDEENVGENHIFYGGIEAYLLQQYPKPSLWRDLLLRLSRQQALLRLMPRFDFGSAVDPVKNAALTISMLRGRDGNQRELLKEMVDWLETDLQPDLVHVTNTLLSGVVPYIKERLNVPVVCGLHGEDIFLQGLPEKYQKEAIEVIRANADHIDHFIAISQYYIDYFVDWIGIDRAKVTLVRPGIELNDYSAGPTQAQLISDVPLTIGYFARISPEKGLHILLEAFIRLHASGEFPGLRLKVGGYLSKAQSAYVKGIQQRAREAGVEDHFELLGTLERQEKLNFYRSIHVFSTPTVYRDPKCLPVLEALASGVPVVQPNHGAFPELVEATGGGVLHNPEDPVDLAHKLGLLLRDPQLRRELGQIGQKAVFDHFSAARMASESIAVYRSLAEHA